METRRRVWAPALAVVVAALTACSGTGTNVASHSASPSPPATASSAPPATSSPSASPTGSPVPSPKPLTGAYGVLVNGPNGHDPYTVSIVGVDGKVAASAQASSPAAVSCANAAAALVSLPVSTSNSRLYFMDGAGSIRYLAPSGDSGHVTSVPAGTVTRRSMFAVSPDDQRIAVIVDDFTSNGASTRLYVEDLNGGGHHVDLFSESGAYTLWPTGWHGTNNLVVAKVPSCTQGGGPFCCGPLELHVVDPATANRRFTIGDASNCRIAGAPSPAGAVCIDTATFTKLTVLNWTAGTVRNLTVNAPSFAYLSPNGSMVAFVDNNGTEFTLGGSPMAGTFACSWIDDTHVLAGGDAQHQPRVGEISTGKIVPVAAQGDCGGRLPGGL